MAAKHLLGLINEVLDLSRIEAGHLDLCLESISVAQIMREAFEMARPLAVPHGIKLHLLAGASDTSEVHADAGRLRQVLINLLANGIKYNRPGGNVSLECQPGVIQPGTEKATARFVVRDTGLGIAPEQLSKLFMPFERLGAESSTVEGTGLGLVLCKRLAEAMDGRIEVESVEGQGSSFSLELPLATISSPLVLESDADGNGGMPAEAASNEEALLLYIEDNPSNMALVEDVIGYRSMVRLLTATTAEAGLALARSELPDLILLDLQLPDLAGDVVLERLRADAQTRDIPVAILSADATTRQIARLLKAGACDYLTKPLDVKRLLSIVDAVVGQMKETF